MVILNGVQDRAERLRPEDTPQVNYTRGPATCQENDGP